MKDLIQQINFSNLIKFKVDHRHIYWINEDVFFEKLEGEEQSFWDLNPIKRLQFADVAIIGGALVKLRAMPVEELMDSVIKSADVFVLKEAPVTSYVRSDKNRIIGKRPK